jgi:hypothetical protein|tara:strand:- start:3735 stop:4556 length:822 start_codon:yes stop_codon:yes gene_type:complete
MSIKTDIEAYVGSITSPDIQAEALQYAKDGVRFISSVVLTNEEMVSRMSKVEELGTSTSIYDLKNTTSLDFITRYDGTRYRECIEGEASKAGLFDDVTSLHNAVITAPVYYIKNNILNVFPTPTDAQKARIGVVEPDVTFAITDAYSSLSKFPVELGPGVTFYAASNVLLNKMNAMGKPTGTTNLTTMIAGSVDTPADRIDITKWFDIVGDYIADEDVELASTYLSTVQTYLQSYQSELTGDQSQYQWYESQYVKVNQLLATFLQPYIGGGGE